MMSGCPGEAAEAHMETLQLILHPRWHITVNARDHKGRTALRIACERGLLQAVTMLLSTPSCKGRRLGNTVQPEPDDVRCAARFVLEDVSCYSLRFSVKELSAVVSPTRAGFDDIVECLGAAGVVAELDEGAPDLVLPTL